MVDLDITLLLIFQDASLGILWHRDSRLGSIIEFMREAYELAGSEKAFMTFVNSPSSNDRWEDVKSNFIIYVRNAEVDIGGQWQVMRKQLVQEKELRNGIDAGGAK